MNDKMISIVIPIYNVEKYVESCIKSVGRQDSLAYEIIIVDDGSQDKSMEIALMSIKKYVPAQIECKVVFQENAGLAAARNTGMAVSTSKWIMFLDSDDMIQERTVSTMLSAITKFKLNIYLCDFLKVYTTDKLEETNKTLDFEVINSIELQELFLRRKIKILAPGTVYNREWLEKKNLQFEKLPFSEDQHFLWRVLLATDQAVIIHEQLYNYLIRPNSIMTASKGDKIIQGYKKIEELYYFIQQDKRAIQDVKKFMLARWVLGALRSSSVMMEWKDYKKVAEVLNYKKQCKKLYKFPDRTVKIMALIANINLRFFYSIIRLLGKLK